MLSEAGPVRGQGGITRVIGSNRADGGGGAPGVCQSGGAIHRPALAAAQQTEEAHASPPSPTNTIKDNEDTLKYILKK